MNEDEQVRERFRRVGFAGEPPMASTATDDLARGRRHVRRRRAAALSGGVVGMVAVAAGVALALPGGGPSGAGDLPVAGSGSSSEAPVEATTTAAPPSRTPSAHPTTDPGHRYPFPATRQLLLDTAVEHLDPAHTHLPAESTGFTGGGSPDAPNVGTKLGWTNAGEDGEGLVRVGVTAPGYVESDEYAVEDFIADFGCDLPDTCAERAVPGTDETVLVAPANPERNLLFAVVRERADGSMVGIAVSDLFGNNSVTPVSEVDITLDQAIAFVTDPDLRVDPDEAAAGWDDHIGTGQIAECVRSGATSASVDAEAELDQACVDQGVSDEPSDTPSSGE